MCDRVALLLSLCWLPWSAAAQAPSVGGWYDPAPLTASLRRAARAELPRSAGLSRLDELPFYDLDLELDADRSSFVLTEHIYYTNRTGQALRDVALRVFANAVPGPAPVTIDTVTCPGTTCTVRRDSTTAITVTPSAALRSGGRLRIDVTLRGRLRHIDSSRTNMLAQGLEGMATMGSNEHAGDYGLLAEGDGILSLANFYAVLARRYRGAWVRQDASTMGDLGSDEMSHMRLRVRASRDLRIVTTGVEVSSRLDGQHRHTEVVAAMVRDFSLLASRHFQVATRRVSDVTVRSHFLPADRAAGERVLDVAAESLRIFERQFGSYPYADLDVVEASLVGGAGGVEFAGLVTVASMLYRPPGGSGTSPLASLVGGAGGMRDMQRRMLEFVTAHEVAHQYWHGLVGSDSREHPFVDESLAQFSAILYLEERYGAARARADGDMQVRMNYQMMRVMGESDGPVDRPVRQLGSPMRYAGLVYGKGPYLYVALRDAVGRPAFIRALHDYVARYRYRRAPRRGFVDVLARGRHAVRVNRLATRWLEQSHGDEDLGQLDMSALMGQLLGSGGGGQTGPDLQQLFRALGGSGAPGGAPASGPAPSPQELQRLMRELQRQLGGP